MVPSEMKNEYTGPGCEAVAWPVADAFGAADAPATGTWFEAAGADAAVGAKTTGDFGAAAATGLGWLTAAERTAAASRADRPTEPALPTSGDGVAATALPERPSLAGTAAAGETEPRAARVAAAARGERGALSAFADVFALPVRAP